MSIKFEPRDIWIGLFWDRRPDGLHIYVCPLPCLVIHWRGRCGPKWNHWISQYVDVCDGGYRDGDH
jgi:hypothetical protein